MKTVICPICKSTPEITNPFKQLDVDGFQLFVCANCGIVFSVIDDLDDI